MDRASGIPALTALGFALSVATVSAQSNAQAARVPWNTDGGHGPNGPWNYIKLNIGSNPSSSVDFYPLFGVPQSDVVRSDACSQATCLDPKPGYYDASASSAQSSSQNVVANLTPLGGDLHVVQGYNASEYLWTDSVSYGSQNMGGDDMILSVWPNVTASHGRKSWVPVSLLSLEPNAKSNPIKTQSGDNATQNTLLEFYTSKTGGSPTIALHMGAAAHKQTGSLILGGYDPSRLIEPPAIFNNLGTVSLKSLSFGFSSGDNPWQSAQSTPPSNFLDGGKAQNVLLSPHIPTLQLPLSVCNVLAQYLPISFDDETSLYLWKTDDPMYKKLITSPSYLNFTFGDTATTSVRVPFAALNLNLTKPVKESPTPYFPCESKKNGANLGRAFLQSAFLLQSYPPNPAIYVGQAPGPAGTQQDGNLVPLAANNPNAQPAGNAPKWEDTWKGVLTPLGQKSAGSSANASQANSNDSNNSTGSGNVNNSQSGGLSSGAIAGVVIAVIFILAISVGIAAFFIKKRRIAAKQAAMQNSMQHEESYGAEKTRSYGQSNEWKSTVESGKASLSNTTQMSGSSPAQEIDSAPRWHEIDSSVNKILHEMPDTSQRPELGSSGRQ